MEREPAGRFETAEQFRLALEGFRHHRGSIALANRARERLERLRTLVSAADGEVSAEAYEVHAECRFGFHSALAEYPANAGAKRGLLEATRLSSSWSSSETTRRQLRPCWPRSMRSPPSSRPGWRSTRRAGRPSRGASPRSRQRPPTGGSVGVRGSSSGWS